MLHKTPHDSYPMIRLPIKGVRGACGSVYHKHGAFYEGVGSDEFVMSNDTNISGVYVDNEWDQTGANSSMFKWLDIFCGVAQARQAYSADPIKLSKMAAVFEGRMESGELGDNPIDSMQRAFDLFTMDSGELGDNPMDSTQRAFDLFTQPPLHTKILVDTEERLRMSGILESKDPSVLLQRLRLAYWVADHRTTHGKYVLASIYQTEPIGGPSRAAGTGGSTPPSLKLFLSQTINPGGGSLIQLLIQQENLSKSQVEEVTAYTQKFDEFEAVTEKVRNKGQRLKFDEKVANA